MMDLTLDRTEPTSDRSISASDLASYRENGVIRLRNRVSAEVLQGLDRELDLFIRDEIPRLTNPLKEVVWSNGQIQQILCLDRYYEIYRFSELVAQTPIAEVVRAILGTQGFLVASQSFLKPPGVGKRMSPHQDDEYSCLKGGKGVNVIVPLDEATVDNGAVYYYLGSHKLGPIQHDVLGVKTYAVGRRHLRGFKVHHQVAQPGDLIFHDALVVHGSGNNYSNRPRRTITFMFAPTPDAVDVRMTEIRAKMSLVTLFESRGRS